MNETIFDQLLNQTLPKPIILDGGMGTTCQDHGIEVSTQLWSSFALLSHEGRAINDLIHKDFVQNGADIVIANTHNTIGCAAFLAQYSLKNLSVPETIPKKSGMDQVQALKSYIISEAVASARRAVPKGRTVVVATCMGSLEGAYATDSHLTVEQIRRQLGQDIPIHLSTETDLLIFETLTTYQEISGTAMAVRDHDLTAFAVGFTCGQNGRTLAGVTMAEAVDIFSLAKPKVFFIQCTDYNIVEPSLNALLSALGPSDIAGVYANDGRHYVSPAWVGPRVSPKEYAQAAIAWHAAGAKVIGGCCGITPQHILELSKYFRP